MEFSETTVGSKNNDVKRPNADLKSEEPDKDEEISPAITDTDDNDLTPDDILQQLGGCGRFQVIISTIVQSMKLVVCWSMVANSFLAYVPEWSCVPDDNGDGMAMNVSNITVGYKPTSQNESVYYKMCENPTGQKCRNFHFDSRINTLVSEFRLVCDLSWVTATITSVQMIGMCVGSLISGHVSDIFGRKPPLCLSIAMLFLFLIVSYFSTSWKMFAVCKFFIGVADAFYLALYCSVQSEYALSKWRSIVVSFPSWALQSSLFSLVAWLLQDWKLITLVNAIVALGLFVISWFVPESFRWYISHGRYKAAKKIVNRVSSWNSHPAPDFDNMCRAVEAQEADSADERYTMLHLFRRKSLLKITIPLVFTWFTLGFIAYGINFGIKKLSGSIYLNIFVFSVASIPSKFISMYLQNRFGRKKASMIALAVCFIGGLAVGVIQSADLKSKNELTNYFALMANVGVDGVWGPVQTFTIELYPTAVRNTGFGFVSILARLGAVVGPQFVYLGDWVPGILYYMIAILSFLSIAGIMFLPETMNCTLVDKMSDDFAKQRRKEQNLQCS